MKRIALAFTLGLALTGQAWAFQCPADMAKIDEALKTAQLTDAQEAEVERLRAEGEELHQAGRHQESVDRLAEAKDILNIE